MELIKSIKLLSYEFKFKKYIDFIINQIITDSEKLQYSYGWNFIIIPYIYWLIIFLLKYLILTIPIWVPINMIITRITDSITITKNKILK